MRYTSHRLSTVTDQCRLCESLQLALLFEVRGCTLHRCGGCGFVQVRDKPSEDELREIYAAAYFARGKYKDDVAQHRETERRLGLLAAAGVAPGARVLDVGCATGDFIAAGAKHYDMWGIDVSAHATAQAREQTPACAGQIFTGFVEDQRFEPASFDAIVMWDVIEHIWDPEPVCRELIRLIKPGGVFILSTPDIGAITARLMRSRWAFMTPPEHLSFFSSPSLAYLFEKLGLETVSSEANGKWANLGFLAYKFRRVFPFVPQGLVTRVQNSPLGRATMYVPTLDVRYVTARKAEA
jgi:2-polyprenyl-3-methyl-5-hydroxy-6-metoxy-1,4-benzoquinol methylase